MRKQTIETNLDPATVEQIDDRTDNKSGWIRQAVREKLEREGDD